MEATMDLYRQTKCCVKIEFFICFYKISVTHLSRVQDNHKTILHVYGTAIVGYIYTLKAGPYRASHTSYPAIIEA